MGAGLFLLYGGEVVDAIVILLPTAIVILCLGVIAARLIAKVWHVLTKVSFVVPSVREVIHARANDLGRIPEADREGQADSQG